MSGLVGLAAFLCLWIYILYFAQNGPGALDPGQQFIFLVGNPFTWLHTLFVPGYILYEILKTVRLLITGEHFVLDKTDGHLLRNGVVKLELAEVSHIRVKKHEDHDSGVDYQLSIVHTGARELPIDRSPDQEGILELAEEIARFVNKEIESL